MSSESKPGGQDTNDSPAFRLRPRAEPKSYYTIRLEYSANPAAFTRERPRSAKRRSITSQRSSYSRSRNRNANGGNSRVSSARPALLNNRYSNGRSDEKPPHVLTKEELERDEKRKHFQREIAQSIKSDTPISPFMQRLGLNELKPETVYEHNYITLRIKSIDIKHLTDSGDRINISDNKCLICRCLSVDDDPISHLDLSGSSTKPLRSPRVCLNVHLFNRYADESIIKVDKIINIGKFKTGPVDSVNPSEQNNLQKDEGHDGVEQLGFNVIVDHQCLESSSSGGRRHLIPFVSVTDMIEELTEPYVEMVSSPTPDEDAGGSVKVNVSAGVSPATTAQ